MKPPYSEFSKELLNKLIQTMKPKIKLNKWTKQIYFPKWTISPMFKPFWRDGIRKSKIKHKLYSKYGSFIYFDKYEMRWKKKNQK